MYDSKMTGATIADIVGRSVVIHAHKDDCISQPIGNSGEFLAEGVISLGNPSEIGTKLPKDNEQEGKMAAKAKSSGHWNRWHGKQIKRRSTRAYQSRKRKRETDDYCCQQAAYSPPVLLGAFSTLKATVVKNSKLPPLR